MLQLPPRPYLDWKHIHAKAVTFADKYRLAEREFPLDVEELIECDLNMEIRLCAGILENCDSPAQIAPGDKHPIIIVDADQFRFLTLRGDSLIEYSFLRIGTFITVEVRCQLVCTTGREGVTQ